jgi:hypothetical protein
MNDIIYTPPYRFMEATAFKIVEVLNYNRIKVSPEWQFAGDQKGDIVFLENLRPSKQFTEDKLNLFVRIILKSGIKVDLINGREININGELVCDMKINGRLIQSYFFM